MTEVSRTTAAACSACRNALALFNKLISGAPFKATAHAGASVIRQNLDEVRKCASLQDSWSLSGTCRAKGDWRGMADGAGKLRAMASQSRSLSRQSADRERARLLRSLAELYDRQAEELEERLSA